MTDSRITITAEGEQAVDEVRDALCGISSDNVTHISVEIERGTTESTEPETPAAADGNGDWAQIAVEEPPVIEPDTEQSKVAALFLYNDVMTRNDVSSHVAGIDKGRASTVCSRLFHRGVLARNDTEKPYRYRLTEAGEESLMLIGETNEQ